MINLFKKLFKKLFTRGNSGTDPSGDIPPPKLSRAQPNLESPTTRLDQRRESLHEYEKRRSFPTSYRDENVRRTTMPVRTNKRDQQAVMSAQQLFDEFKDHIVAEISDGECRDTLKECIRQLRGSTEPSVFREALQTVASRIAGCIRDHFQEKLSQEITESRKSRWRAQLPVRPLQNADDYSKYLSEFVQQNLTRFYKPHGKNVKDIATQAAEMVSSEVNVSHELIPGLAKLALFDFVIFCDNSCSMKSENRFDALKDTLRRVARFATILSPQGISVRILNYDDVEQGSWDGLKTVEDINERIQRVDYVGGTPLGTKLYSKVLEPMILSKARSRQLEKPVIVIIITDALQPNNEPRQTLRDKIRDCNNEMNRRHYDKASVIYLISRVGSSTEARQFIQGLGEDPQIGSTVYVSTLDLASKRAIYEGRGDDEYTSLLIRLCLSALDVRTSTSPSA